MNNSNSTSTQDPAFMEAFEVLTTTTDANAFFAAKKDLTKIAESAAVADLLNDSADELMFARLPSLLEQGKLTSYVEFLDTFIDTYQSRGTPDQVDRTLKQIAQASLDLFTKPLPMGSFPSAIDHGAFEKVADIAEHAYANGLTKESNLTDQQKHRFADRLHTLAQHMLKQGDPRNAALVLNTLVLTIPEVGLPVDMPMALTTVNQLGLINGPKGFDINERAKDFAQVLQNHTASLSEGVDTDSLDISEEEICPLMGFDPSTDRSAIKSQLGQLDDSAKTKSVAVDAKSAKTQEPEGLLGGF